MTIQNLFDTCSTAIANGKGDYEVLFDTEAMSFLTHMVKVSSAIVEDTAPDLKNYLILNYDMSREKVKFSKDN